MLNELGCHWEMLFTFSSRRKINQLPNVLPLVPGTHRSNKPQFFCQETILTQSPKFLIMDLLWLLIEIFWITWQICSSFGPYFSQLKILMATEARQITLIIYVYKPL